MTNLNQTPPKDNDNEVLINLLEEDYTIYPLPPKSVTGNYLFPQGALNTASLQTLPALLDTVLNEIARRYWIIALEFSSEQDSVIYYILKKPVCTTKNTNLSTMSFKDFLYLTTNLDKFENHNKAEKELIFNWTSMHNWTYLDIKVIKDILNEIGNDTGFYYHSYWWILYNTLKTNASELNTYKNIHDTNEVNLEVYSKYLSELTNSYFNNASIISNKLQQLEQLVNDKKIDNTDSDYQLLSLLYVIQYIPNLNKFNFKEDELNSILKGLLSLKVHHKFKYTELNGITHMQQLNITTSNTKKSLAFLNTDNMICNAINQTSKNGYYILNILQNFFVLMKKSYLESTSHILAHALYSNLAFSNKNVPSLDFHEFYAKFLTYQDKLTNEAYMQEFYLTYIKPLSRFQLEKMHANLINDEKKYFGDWAKNNVNLDIKYVLAYCFQNNNFSILTPQELHLKPNVNYTPFAYDKIAPKVIDKALNAISVINTSIKIHTYLNEKYFIKDDNLLNKLYWTFNDYYQTYYKKIEHSIYGSINDLIYVKTFCEVVNNYCIFDANSGALITTYNDYLEYGALITNLQSNLALRINFLPNRFMPNSTLITFSDESFQRKSFKIEQEEQRFLFGCDSKTLSLKMGWLLDTYYNHKSDYDEYHSIKQWKNYHLGIIGYIQLFYATLSISNEKPTFDISNWNEGLKNSTLDRLYRSIVNFTLINKLGTTFDVWWGNGEDGKSYLKEKIKKAIGYNNVLELTEDSEERNNRFNNAKKRGKLLDIKEDVSAESINTQINNLKALSTNDSMLTGEEKKEKGTFTVPNILQILLLVNEISDKLFDTYAISRRIRCFKVSSQQERISKKIYQPNAFNISSNSNIEELILPVAYNTYSRNLYFAKKEDDNWDLSKMLSDTAEMSKVKIVNGITLIEQYLITLITTYIHYKNNETNLNLKYAPVVYYQNNNLLYYVLRLPIRNIYKYFETWAKDRQSSTWKNFFSQKSFLDNIKKAMSKPLWSNQFGIISATDFIHDALYQTQHAILLLPVEKYQDFFNFSIEQNLEIDINLIVQPILNPFFLDNAFTITQQEKINAKYTFYKNKELFDLELKAKKEKDNIVTNMTKPTDTELKQNALSQQEIDWVYDKELSQKYKLIGQNTTPYVYDLNIKDNSSVEIEDYYDKDSEILNHSLADDEAIFKQMNQQTNQYRTKIQKKPKAETKQAETKQAEPNQVQTSQFHDNTKDDNDELDVSSMSEEL